jgi:hypothetical protein
MARETLLQRLEQVKRKGEAAVKKATNVLREQVKELKKRKGVVKSRAALERGTRRAKSKLPRGRRRVRRHATA